MPFAATARIAREHKDFGALAPGARSTRIAQLSGSRCTALCTERIRARRVRGLVSRSAHPAEVGYGAAS